MKNKKSIFKLLKVFIISFVILEIFEFIIFKIFDFDPHQLQWGWIGFILIYGFKYHIFCCLIPAIWAGYKCKHKDCKHDYCEHQ